MLSAEENGVENSQMIDCTAIIETVTEKTSEHHAASIQSISDDFKSQQKQIMEHSRTRSRIWTPWSLVYPA